ncbi:MAG: acyl-CoA/acyl-ACP dehydrogenase [Solirubrobacterales bacterium]|nr:acyl-CoA/acyl-ACP dehydrogenase [Solirubrobacterales bacterium]
MSAEMLEWYDLTGEERRIRDLAAEVARAEIAPRADAHDMEGTFVRDSIEALGRAGLLGVYVPKEYGGLGGSPLATVLAIEIVSAACGSTGMSFMFHNNLIHVVDGAGPEELKAKYFPRFAEGRLGAFAINEQRRLFRERFDTTAADAGDEYIVNGEKPFVTSAGEADVYIVQCQLEDGPPSPIPVMGQRYILIEGGYEGVGSWVYDPMGLRGASNGGVTFKDVHVPKENAVGAEPDPMVRSVAAKGNSAFSPHLISMGCARAALEAAVSHCRKRGPEEWQSHVLATLSDQLNALRCYTYYAARLMERPVSRELNHAHNEIQRLGGALGPEVGDRIMEVIGGASFMRTSPIQRYFRDARGSCYPAFAMEHRRANVADGLFGADAYAEQGPTMPWDPHADYNFWLLWARGAAHLPEEAKKRMSRAAFEEFARSRGSDRMTVEICAEYMTSAGKPPGVGGPPGAGGPPRTGDGGGPEPAVPAPADSP